MDEVDFVKSLEKLQREFKNDYWETLALIEKMEKQREMRLRQLIHRTEMEIYNRLDGAYKQDKEGK